MKIFLDLNPVKMKNHLSNAIHIVRTFR